MPELDNTKASCFRTCKRKYYWQHILGLQSIFGSSAIRYGVIWHGIMEGYYKYIKENGWGSKELAISAGLALGKKKWDEETAKKTFLPDYRTFDAACTALLHYLSFYSKDEEYIKIINTEAKFKLEITPDNQEESLALNYIVERGDHSKLYFTGRLDLQVEMNFSNWILDFKTTGQNLSMQASRLNRSGQLIGYSYAGKHALEFPTEGCLVGLAYVSAYKSKKTGEYGDVTTDFGRIPQIYNDKDLVEWKKSFIDTALDITRSIESNNWPVNFDSCYQYGPCTYTKLCDQSGKLDSVITEGYLIEHWDVLKEVD
jgi:hypothetical protein